MRRTRVLLMSTVVTTLLGSAMVGTTAGATEAPARTVRVIVPTAGSLTNLALNVAERAGYFADQGLTVEVTGARTGGADIQVLAAGEVDFDLVAAAGILGAIPNGVPIKSVLSLNERPIGSVVLSTAVAEELGVTSDSPLEERWAALKDRKIGVSSPQGFFGLMGEYMISEQDLGSAELIPLGGGPEAFAGFEAGAADAVFYSSPVPEQAIEQGLGISLIRPGEGDMPEFDPFFMTGLAATTSTLQEDPDMVRAFVAALQRAIEHINTQDAASIAELVAPDFSGLDQNALVSSIETAKSITSASGCHNPEAVDVLQEWAVNDWGGIDAPVPNEDFYTDEFLTGCE